MINQFSKNLYYTLNKLHSANKDVFRSISITFSKIKAFTDFILYLPCIEDRHKNTAANRISRINNRQLYLATNQSKMLLYSETVWIHPQTSILQQASIGYHSSKDLKTKPLFLDHLHRIGAHHKTLNLSDPNRTKALWDPLIPTTASEATST